MRFVEQEHPRKNDFPRLVKIVILGQSAIILAFTVGMYQEYLGNAYFQDYVVALFRSSVVADTLLSMVTISVFAIGTLTLLGSVRLTGRASSESRALSDPFDEAMEMPAMPVLETVNPASGAKSSTRRPRQRKSRFDADEVFRSRTRYTRRSRE